MTARRAIRTISTRMTGGSSGGSGGAVAGGLVPLCARLRHQRLDPRAVVAVRDFRPEADLWPAVARAHVSVRREPRSSRPVRAHAARSRARLRRDAGPRSGRPGLRRPAGRADAAVACRAALDGLRIAVAGGYFTQGRFPEALEAVDSASRRRSAPTREIEFPEAQRARAAAYVITATRRRGAASRPAAHARRTISIRRCATG